MASDAQKRANERYARLNAKQKAIRFFPPDYDLLEWVDENGEPFATYVKRLIREDMEKHQANA